MFREIHRIIRVAIAGVVHEWLRLALINVSLTRRFLWIPGAGKHPDVRYEAGRTDRRLNVIP